MRSIVWYQFGNPFKVKFRKHICFFCGNDLSIRKHSKVVNSKSDEAQYYDFSVGETSIKGDVEFIHKLFFCENCKKDFEFVTQISFEDHQKKENKFCSKFCKNLGIGEMKKVWVDTEGKKHDIMPQFENIAGFMISLKLKDEEFVMVKSEIKKKEFWGRPIYITFQMNRDIKKFLRNLKTL